LDRPRKERSVYGSDQEQSQSLCLWTAQASFFAHFSAHAQEAFFFASMESAWSGPAALNNKTDRMESIVNGFIPLLLGVKTELVQA
jgi:hypothetical protein